MSMQHFNTKIVLRGTVYRSATNRRKTSVWIAGGLEVEPPTVFSTPLTHCQIMYRGVSNILYTYDLHYNFVRSPTVEKFNPHLTFHKSNTA